MGLKRKRVSELDSVWEVKKFTSEMWKRVEAYKKGVLDGSIISNRWIMLAIQRGNLDHDREDLYYSKEAVDRVFEFFSFLSIPIKKKPRQFKLTPYQAWIISELFGWYRVKDDTRRYRYGVIHTARKSGKTMYAVSILLYLFCYDREYDPEAYLLATTREQASQALKYSKTIVKNSKRLNKRITRKQYSLTHSLKGEGICKTLASVAERLDSLNPNGCIIDEMHAHEDLSLYNVMKSGVMARENPLILITSTAGFHRDYPYFSMLERAKKVLLGEAENDSMFYALYTLDDTDEVEDSSTWVKANPNLGVTIPINALDIEWDQAKSSIIERLNFIVKNLNVYQDSETNWIPDEDYMKCFRPVDINSFKGCKAYIGTDLSATRDIASLAIIIEDEDGKFHLFPEFYFPQNETKKLRSSGIDFTEWIEKGWIHELQDKTINHDYIFERIQFYNEFLDIVSIGYDPWNANLLFPKVELELGIKCLSCRQNTSFFNFPLKYLEKQIFEQNINLSVNPVLRWMFRNVVLYFDGNNNVKIAKNKSDDSVDGAVAAAMAIGMWIEENFNIEELALSDHINKGKEE